MLRTRSPFKLKLEIRVSVRISWENFNANRFFPFNLNIFNDFHFQTVEGGRRYEFVLIKKDRFPFGYRTNDYREKEHGF